MFPETGKVVLKNAGKSEASNGLKSNHLRQTTQAKVRSVKPTSRCSKQENENVNKK